MLRRPPGATSRPRRTCRTSRSSAPHSRRSAPDTSPVALLLVDVINDFDFPEAEQLLHFAVPMARRLAIAVRIVVMFVAVTRTRSVLPSSTAFSTYVRSLAEPISEQLPPSASQRRQA